MAFLVASIVLVSVQYHRQVKEARYWMRHTQEVIEASHTVLSQILELETGQRGYLLSLDEKYLEPYAGALGRVTGNLDTLRRLVADNPEQKGRVIALGEVVGKKLDELNRTIRLAKERGSDAALEVVRTGAGKELMDDTRARLASVIQVERNLLEARQRELDRVELLAVVLAGIGTTLAVALLLGALWLAVRETTRRRRWLANETALRKEATVAHARAETAYRERERFLASAAHDLRQPLHLIHMALIAIEDAEPGRHAALLRPVRRAIGMLDRTLEQFIDARRLTMDVWAPALAPLAVPELFQGMQETYGPLAARAGLRFRCRPLDAWVMTDKGMTERVLSNLLLNAIKYTQTDGLLLAARRRGDKVALQVWDTGIGISRQEFEDIFREFGRAGKHGKEGLGLGLFISGKIARALGTELTVASKLGAGSCFSFSLPIARAPERATGFRAPERADVARTRSIETAL